MFYFCSTDFASEEDDFNIYSIAVNYPNRKYYKS